MPAEFLSRVAGLGATQQDGADYGLSASLGIKEEIARYWRIGSDLHRRYAERRGRQGLDDERVGVEEWLVPFLNSLLGYDDLAETAPVALDDRVFKLSHHAFSGAVPALLTTRAFDLDKAYSHFGQEGRRQAPHGSMQEYLNCQDAALWGLVGNGARLRLLRDNPSLTRPAYIEADLDLIFDEELYPDFAALWLAAHASRLQPQGPSPADCIIEAWRTEAHETGQRVLADLRHGVTEALRVLGTGFLQHPRNDGLRTDLQTGTLTREQFFEQLLRLVYRLLFLFVAEERDLLHAPEAGVRERSVFTDGYSLARLRERALRRRHYDRHADLWLGLQVAFRGLSRGAPGLGLPALGGLFRTDVCPALDRALVANESILEAVRNLAYFHSEKALSRVNFRDMDTEELGSVYESLLELQPVVDVEASPWTFAFASDRGSARKLTGSYYTPPALVHQLVTSTLDPVIEQAKRGRPEDPVAALLDISVLDPACGSGHFLLAAARRLASEIARLESGADSPDEATRRHALREVVRHCVHGVDRNPLSVELCKTALWIETVEPGKPLTFLDGHIRLGDSLVGILDPEVMAGGIPPEAYKPLTGDDKAVCRELKTENRQARQKHLFDRDGGPDAPALDFRLDAMPEDTLEDVDRKRKALQDADADPQRLFEALRADMFVGAFFMTKARETARSTPLTGDLLALDAGERPRRGVAESAGSMAREHRFMHWHLAFPRIMGNGGFDVILTNPPWKVAQHNEEKFFAPRAPSVAELAGAVRKRAIAELEHSDPELWRSHRNALRGYRAFNVFARNCGRFSLSAHGKLNSYALFSETLLQLTNAGGRAGVIVPSGIATDDSTKAFFEHLVSRRRLASLYDFENREKLFDIDSRIKFCLLTIGGAGKPIPEAEFAFFLRRPEQLKEQERRYTLTASDLALFNPNTRTAPTFRTRRDMDVARKLYRRAGVLWREARGEEPEHNAWAVGFMQMFNMTSDSALFRTLDELQADGWELKGNVFWRDDEQYLPLYEAKLFHQYDHRFATFEGASAKDLKNGRARAMTTSEKRDPEAVVLPRYWVPAAEVERKLGVNSTERPAADPDLELASGPAGQRASGPAGQRASGPAGQRASGPAGQRASGPAEEFSNGITLALRLISRATDRRTTLSGVIPRSGLGHKAAVVRLGVGGSLCD